MLLFPFILVYSQGKYHINGILNNDYNGKYVKLFQFQGDTLITSIDSAKVQRGEFFFEGTANVDNLLFLLNIPLHLRRVNRSDQCIPLKLEQLNIFPIIIII